MTPEVCPNCGAEVPRNARACPECGSDEKTGWGDAHSGGLDLPDEFDYNEYVQREFGSRQPRPYGIRWFWWTVGVLMAAVFIWSTWRFLF